MKKRIFVLSIFSLLALASCGNEANVEDSGSSASIPSVSESSVEANSSSSGSFSSESLASSESIEESSEHEESSSEEAASSSIGLAYSSIEEVKAACSSIAAPLNGAGYVVSSSTYKIKAKILAVIDSIATKEDYKVSNRYKAFVQDESGFMYVAFNEAGYKKVKDYVGKDNTVYSLVGKASRYYDQPELVVEEYTFENEVLPGLSPLSSFETRSLSSIKEEIAGMPISEKGVSYGKPVVFEATYIDELVQESLLFSDGDLTISLHGSSKISNGFAKGSTYKVAALLGLYSYRPSLEFLGMLGSGGEVHSLPSPDKKTASDQYKITYAKDKALHSPVYEEEFYKAHRFEGYVSCYTKDSDTYFVLSDAASKEYSTYTDALSDKALFVNKLLGARKG